MVKVPEGLITTFPNIYDEDSYAKIVSALVGYTRL